MPGMGEVCGAVCARGAGLLKALGTVCVGLACVASSGRADVVTLRSLEAQALSRRPALDAGAARVRAGRADLDKARSAYYPRLSLEAAGAFAPGGSFAKVADVGGNQFWVSSPRRVEGDLFGGGAAVPQLRSELGLELKGTLYDFGRTAAGVSAYQSLVAATEAELKTVQHTLVRGVRAGYLGWLGSSELFRVAERAQKDAEARRSRVEALISEGVRPRSDLPAARADELLTQLELERARGELRAAKLALEQAVGSPLAEGAEPDRSLLEQASGPVNEASHPSPASVALERWEVATAAKARAMAKMNAPVLSAGLAVGLRFQNDFVANESFAFPAYTFGLRFSVPLLDGGEASATARASREQAAEAAARARQQHEQDQIDVQRARLDVENAEARLRTAELLLEIANQRLQDAEQGYELGASDLEGIANARTLLRRAQTEAIMARLARAQARLL